MFQRVAGLQADYRLPQRVVQRFQASNHSRPGEQFLHQRWGTGQF